MDLKPHQVMALECLRQGGPHSVGLIDDEFKLAAALTFIGLQDQGFVMSSIETDGPKFRLTPKGLAAISSRIIAIEEQDGKSR